MNRKFRPDIAFLGAGGKDPRVDIFNTYSYESQALTRLPKNQSAYVMDINSDKSILAIGTKGGLIFLIDASENRKHEEQISTRQLIQGAPVLSVCWVNDSMLAASDSCGRSFLWHSRQETPLCPLETAGGVICSLINLSDGILAGLSSAGWLCFWQPDIGHLIRKIKAPSPPPISALVDVIYWPKEKSLAYPGSGGRLILYNLEKEKINSLDVHKEDFYALSLLEENLLTAGIEDQCLKIWPSASDRPSCELQMLEGVISMGVVESLPPQIILIKTNGTAVTYAYQGNKIQPVDQSSIGTGYRAIVTHPPEIIKAYHIQQKEKEVRQILNEIQKSIAQESPEIINRLYSRLIELGYEQISLAIQAQQALQNDDIIEGLRIYASLMDILPINDPKSCFSMERYAKLLERMWQTPEAINIYKRILSVNPNYPFAAQQNNLEEIAKHLSGNQWIIEPGVDIYHIIKAATVTGKQFNGRYMITKIANELCDRSLLSPEIISKKYEQVRKENGDKKLPPSSVDKVWWISRKGVEPIEIVTFGDGISNGIKGLQFSLQVFPGNFDTTVVPVILFDWRNTTSFESVEDANMSALRTMDRITENALSNSYLATIHKVLKQALRRLVSESRSQKKIQ